jgi:hypothetical protein
MHAEAEEHETELRSPWGALGVGATVHVDGGEEPADSDTEATPRVLATIIAGRTAMATIVRRAA